MVLLLLLLLLVLLLSLLMLLLHTDLLPSEVGHSMGLDRRVGVRDHLRKLSFSLSLQFFRMLWRGEEVLQLVSGRDEPAHCGVQGFRRDRWDVGSLQLLLPSLSLLLLLLLNLDRVHAVLLLLLLLLRERCSGHWGRWRASLGLTAAA